MNAPLRWFHKSTVKCRIEWQEYSQSWLHCLGMLRNFIEKKDAFDLREYPAVCLASPGSPWSIPGLSRKGEWSGLTRRLAPHSRRTGAQGLPCCLGFVHFCCLPRSQNWCRLFEYGNSIIPMHSLDTMEHVKREGSANCPKPFQILPVHRRFLDHLHWVWPPGKPNWVKFTVHRRTFKNKMLVVAEEAFIWMPPPVNLRW